MYFNNKFIQHKYIARRKQRKSLNKIFVSKAEIKHTSSKAIITIYVYNREKIVLFKKLKNLRKSLFSFILKKRRSNLIMNYIFSNKFLLALAIYGRIMAKSDLREMERRLRFYNILRNSRRFPITSRFILNIKCLSLRLYKWLTYIRKYRLRLNLNKYKFEEKFLFRLSDYISKYYGKKVEFNIVNLKSIAYNGDIFTEILTSITKREKVNPVLSMNTLLNRAKLPKVNRVIERGRIENSVNSELFENKYKNNYLSSLFNKNLLPKDNLNNLLYNIYYNPNLNEEDLSFSNKKDYLNIRDIILDNIKYKNMACARLIIKGRLTKRYRADRAVYKLKWKGGLKNIDSAFKGLSTVLFRGHLDSNVEKSMLASKRRIGSFAVKGWFSGK